MNIFKKWHIFFITLCLYFSSSPLLAASSVSSSETGPAYLYVQSAQSAEINKNKGKEQYIIILKKPDPLIIYFTDRPERQMGFMSLDDFLTYMKKEEKKYTPKGLNAAVVSVSTGSKFKTLKYIFTLHDAQYNKKDSTVIFHAKAVPDDTQGAQAIPSHLTLKHTALFIDACVGCVPPP